MPKRQRYLFVCNNSRPDGVPKGSCAKRGAGPLHEALKAKLKARGLAEVGARACTSSCLDVCWVGPVIAVEPDGYFYGRVTVDDVDELVDAIERGERVERLVLSDADFVEPRALSE